jgi:hypothetical protein
MASVSTYRGPTHRDLLVTEVADRLKMESDIIGERWRRLKAASVRVQNHKDAFRRECAMIAEEKELLEEDRKQFEIEVSTKWPAAALDDAVKMERYKLNVGGSKMEATAEVLTRDRFSVLSTLCSENSPFLPDDDGSYYFDRDGLLFEHVLNFLRDGILPDDEETLRGMYNEAAFFRLGLLKRHIEAKFEDLSKRRQQIYEASIKGQTGIGQGMTPTLPMGNRGVPMQMQMQMQPQPQAIMMNQQMPNIMQQPTATMYSNGGGVPMQPPPGMQMGGAAYNNQQQMMMNGSIGATGGTPMMDPFLTMTTNHIDMRTNTLPDPFGFTKKY